MGRGDDWWVELLGGNTLVFLLIFGLAFFLLNRNDLTDKKSALKLWNTNKPSDKLLMIAGCIFISYILYNEFKQWQRDVKTRLIGIKEDK